MNILFLYSSPFDPEKGGVQRVTKALGYFFYEKKYIPYYLSLKKSSKTIDNQFYLPDDENFNVDRNIEYLKKFISDKKIRIIINQGALGPACSEFAYHGQRPGTKLISVIHNSPLASIQNYSTSKYSQYRKYNLTFLLPLTNAKFIKRLILSLYKIKYKRHYSKLIKKSDKVLLLSDSYKSELDFFVQTNISSKVLGIPNPISLQKTGTENWKKEKIVLYVGRIDFTQKKVDYLIKIWASITDRFPDWKLKIVGDGPDLNEAKKICTDMKLERVFFEGFKDPTYYYKKASILCMTSSFEGFPMVLVEGQYYGLASIAFNSFASIKEVIKNDFNGILIEPFDIDSYARELGKLMNNPVKINYLSNNASEYVKQFSIETIGNQWLKLFNDLTQEYVS